MVNAAVKAFGRLDILVVNHGVWESEDVPIELMTEEQWRRTIGGESGLGVWAGAGGGDADAAAGAASGWSDGPKGHIVLISSTAGQRGEALHADYAVTKGALISLTKSLSSELAPRGFRVNCVAPGWVATEMSAGRWVIRCWSRESRAGIPVGRVATRARLPVRCCFLCTPLAGFISGEVLNVNGGAVLVG